MILLLTPKTSIVPRVNLIRMLSGPPQWAKVKVIHTFEDGFRKALKGKVERHLYLQLLLLNTCGRDHRYHCSVMNYRKPE